MEKINRFSLHLINVVQYKRLDSGKSAYQFSLDLKKSRNYVSQIEHVNEDGQYNSADYPLIAAELECELSDILPPDDKLYKHLSTKDASERAVIKKVWDEFIAN